jgi:hypothetical protein
LHGSGTEWGSRSCGGGCCFGGCCFGCCCSWCRFYETVSAKIYGQSLI